MSRQALKQDVLNALGQKGIMSHLQAQYVALTVKEIAQSDIAVLKPYRTVKDEEAHKLAGQIVIQYFAKYGLGLSMDSALAESNCQIETGEDAPVVLGIDRREIWIKELLRDWNERKEEIRENNRKKFLDEITEKLKSLEPQKPKKVAFETAKLSENIPLSKQTPGNSDVEMIRKSQDVEIEHDSSSVSITGDLDDVEIDDSPKEDVFTQRDESTGDIDVMTGSGSDVDDFDAPTPKKSVPAPQTQTNGDMEESDSFNSVNSDDVELDQSTTRDEFGDDFDDHKPADKGQNDYSSEAIELASSDDFDSKVIPSSQGKTNQVQAQQNVMSTDSEVSLDESIPEQSPARQNPVAASERVEEEDDISVSLSDW